MECAAKYARETHHCPADDILNISVSCDGTWMKRGLTSIHGVVAVIAQETGQVIDYAVLTKSCHMCKLMRKSYPSELNFQIWYDHTVITVI